MVLWQVAAAVVDSARAGAGAVESPWSAPDFVGAILAALIGAAIAFLVGWLAYKKLKEQNEILKEQNELFRQQLEHQRDLPAQEQRRQEAEEARRKREAEETDKGRYLDWIINQHRFLNITGMRAQSDVDVELEQVYVSLRADPRALALREVEGEELLRQRGLGKGAARPGWKKAEDEKTTIAGALGFLDQDWFFGLVVLGGPGTGKTTVLKYLALTYARGLQQERLQQAKPLLPLLVTLRDLTAEWRQRSLAEHLSQVCNAAGKPTPAAFFAARLEAGECLVLLDGLDEVANPAQRQAVAEWIKVQCEACAANPFVVTCRSAGFREEYLPPRFLRLDIEDFDEEDVKQFSRNWYLAVETMRWGDSEEGRKETLRRSEEKSDDLLKAIENNDRVRTLAVNPLMLSIIALVHRRDLVLPKRRVDLYARCMEILLVAWEEAKQLPVPIPAGKSLQVLQPLALWMHEQRQDPDKKEWAPHRREIEQLMAPHLVGIGLKAEDARAFLDSIRDRSGLLVERSLDIFGFQHQTFQEYLAAREIAARGREGLLLGHFGEDYWREVTLLYAGTEDSSALLGGILGLSDDLVMGQWPLVLQLQEEALSVDAQTRQAIVSHPLAVLLRAEGPALGARAAIHARRPSPAVDILLQLFAEVQAPLAKGHLALLLGESGAQRAMAVLEPHLADENLHLRCMCALALDLLGYEHRQALDDILMVRIPAGEFVMGGERYKDEKPVRRVQTGTFLMDRFPLTVGQYRRFVEAKGYQERRHWSAEGWKWKEEEQISAPSYMDDPQFSTRSAPVVGISWYEAEAYGRWAGKRLPTEQEWERAARGDVEVREYPWGDDFDAGRCNTDEGGIGQPTPVGSYPNGISPHGCFDMAGNVWEWIESLYEKGDLDRVLRGGSWFFGRGYARCACRDGDRPEDRYVVVGVRFSRTS